MEENKLLKRVIKIIFKTFLIVLLLIVLLFIFRGTFTIKYYSSDGFSSESMTIYFGFIYSYSLGSDIGDIDSQVGYIIKNKSKYSFKLFPFVGNYSQKFPQNFYKIFWGEREYLVEENSISFFCNQYNSGSLKENFSEPIFQIFLVNNFDSKSEPVGKPILPLIFKKHLYDIPIEAFVLEKYEDSFSVKINKGKRDNIFIGCTFYDNSEHRLSYDVNSMGDSTSIAQNILAYTLSKEDELDNRFNRNIPSLRERYESMSKGSILSTFYLNH